VCETRRRKEIVGVLKSGNKAVRKFSFYVAYGTNMCCTNIKWKFWLLKFYSGRLRALLLTLSEGGVVHNSTI